MVEWREDRALKKDLISLIKGSKVSWVNISRVFAYRSLNAKTRAYARIWGLSRIWQEALKISPAYIIEVISEKYDKLSKHEKNKILLHELVHIPKNFSGALIPHTRRRKGSFRDTLKKLYEDYNSARRQHPQKL